MRGTSITQILIVVALILAIIWLLVQLGIVNL